MDDSKPCAGFEDQSQCTYETSASFGKYVEQLLEQTAKTGPQGAAGVDAAAQAERLDQLTDRQEGKKMQGPNLVTRTP
jgi:hypothetical protein